MIAPHVAPHPTPHPAPHVEPHPLTNPAHPLYWATHPAYHPATTSGPLPAEAAPQHEMTGGEVGLVILSLFGVLAAALLLAWAISR